MKNEKNKRGIVALVLLGLGVFMLSSVSAYGAVTPYWDENPLKLEAGESSSFNLVLQNMLGGEDYTFRSEISSDPSGIATITGGEDYLVPFGREDINVPVSVTVPEGAAIGTTYEVAVSFKEVSEGNGGMVSVTGGFTTKFVIEVVSPVIEEVEPIPQVSESEGSSLKGIIITVIVVITVLLIVFFLFIKRKKALLVGQAKV